jgi:hypothetical protein
VTAFAGKCQQIFMPAARTFDTGETMVQITTAWLSSAKLKIAVDNLFGVGAEKSILFAKHLIISLFKGFEIIFNTLIILTSYE